MIRMGTLAVLTLFIDSSLAIADDPADGALAAQVSELAREFVAGCEFTVGKDRPRLLTLQPKPILRWSNPTVGQVFGDVLLWTDRGRPAVVTSYYKFFKPDWGRTLEVSSLAAEPVTGKTKEETAFWDAAAQSELKWSAVSDAERPAPTPAARLVQMRRTAAEFHARLADTRNANQGVSRELRQLTQPVYRYPPPSSDSDYLDGALFAFVEGTDPEVWLLLEAASDNRQAAWRYGLARMNGDAMVVTHRDQIVWQTEHIPNVLRRSHEPYALFGLEHPLRPAGPLPRNNLTNTP